MSVSNKGEVCELIKLPQYFIGLTLHSVKVLIAKPSVYEYFDTCTCYLLIIYYFYNKIASRVAALDSFQGVSLLLHISKNYSSIFDKRTKVMVEQKTR